MTHPAEAPFKRPFTIEPWYWEEAERKISGYEVRDADDKLLKLFRGYDTELQAIWLRDTLNTTPAPRAEAREVAERIDIPAIVRKHFGSGLQQQLLYPVWKDGIDIDRPTVAVAAFVAEIATLIASAQGQGGDVDGGARERLAAAMIECGLATGHGDTLEDLLGEMKAQVIERAEKYAAAQVWSPDAVGIRPMPMLSAWPRPWRYEEAGYNEGPCIKDKNGQVMAILSWPIHHPDATKLVERQMFYLGLLWSSAVERFQALNRHGDAALASQPPLGGQGGERDWPEDFAGENGNYQCRCIKCQQLFTGHKRRVVCKLCTPTPAQQTGAGGDMRAEEAEIDRIMALSDEEVIAETRAAGLDPDKVVADGRAALAQAITISRQLNTGAEDYAKTQSNSGVQRDLMHDAFMAGAELQRTITRQAARASSPGLTEKSR